jgi:hypothetical protein
MEIMMKSINFRVWPAAGAALLFGAALTAHAGVFALVPYNNNPDKFCREGMPSDGWVPVDYKTGTWRPTGKSKHVNHRYIPLYQMICPAGAMGNYPAAGGSSAQSIDPAAVM